MKTFSALGLKSHSQEKEKEKKKEEEKEKKTKKKKDKKKKDSSIQKDATAQKVKSKPSKEKKKRLERSPSPISKERRVSKRKLLKITKETFSSSNVEDETSTIATEPMNASLAAKLATILSRPFRPI